MSKNFPNKRIHKKNVQKKQEKTRNKRSNWKEYPPNYPYGNSFRNRNDENIIFQNRHQPIPEKFINGNFAYHEDKIETMVEEPQVLESENFHFYTPNMVLQKNLENLENLHESPQADHLPNPYRYYKEPLFNDPNHLLERVYYLEHCIRSLTAKVSELEEIIIQSNSNRTIHFEVSPQHDFSPQVLSGLMVNQAYIPTNQNIKEESPNVTQEKEEKVEEKKSEEKK